ncbi:MAG: hypothetical protein QME74_04730 [Candidatus Edwardsbacteria bacterium]|nr:hypothetical protein [Candidatus Edwardsbacteria bacterium]
MKYLKKHYIPDLEVSDEGDYWETGNMETLKERIASIAACMDKLEHALSSADFGDLSECSVEEIASMIERLLSKKLGSKEINKDNAQ